MLEIGINTNNDCGANAFERLKLIKNSGFKNVMIDSKDGDLEANIREALRLGLKVSSVHLSSREADCLWNMGETNVRYMNQIINEIEICGKYNIPVAVMHATEGDPTTMLISLNDHGIGCMEKLVEVAKKNKVKIALENLDNSNIKRLLVLLDSINSKWLGLCYDVGHHQLYNSQIDFVRKYANRLYAVHIHDNLMDYEYGCDYTRDLHLLPFDGKIDFGKICRKLIQVAYEGVLMLEVHKNGPAEPRPYKNVSDSEFLNEAHARASKLVNAISSK